MTDWQADLGKNGMDLFGKARRESETKRKNE
jgi:hypothetical protein